MKSRSLFFILIFFAFTLQNGLSGCRHDRSISKGFYYWKSVFKLEKEDSSFLKRLNIEHLYVRFFDVDWDGEKDMAVPIAPVYFQTNLPQGIEIVPVVYLRNQVFSHGSPVQDSILASKICLKIFEMLRHFGLKDPQEIQIDCDWTVSSRDRYFYFLKRIRQSALLNNKLLSATIRLHQVKYLSRTGVPPVDKGVLMCYNTGGLKNVLTSNSIFDANLCLNYLDRLQDYPLKLDVALPCFDWAVCYRDKQFLFLVNGLHESDLDTTNFNKIRTKFYRVKSSDYRFGTDKLIRGDLIRIEHAEASDLENVSRFISSRLQNADPHILFFQLKALEPNAYKSNEFEKIYTLFK